MGFENIIGHEKSKNLLRMFLENKNVPHAFLFYGQEGIGKKLVAKEFAKHLFCKTGSACGECNPCIKLERGSHPDLILIEGDNSIGIDQSRMLSKEICEYPYESEKRVIIIDQAETLTREAANALLKTLEEPPPYNHFFLITSAEKEIPPTIRSRCNRVFFTPLSREQLKHFFLQSIDADEERADLLAGISYGSISCGLFWAEKDNFLLRRMIIELITGNNKSFVRASSIAEKIAKTNMGLGMYLAFLLSFFRDLLVVKHSQDLTLIVNRDVEELLDWQRADIQWIESTIKRIQETTAIMRYNVNKWLAFENLLFQVMR
jgi:DNA polymerase III subunit delta'